MSHPPHPAYVHPMETILDQLSVTSFRSQIFTIADALLGGTPITVSSGGGGSTSDLPKLISNHHYFQTTS